MRTLHILLGGLGANWEREQRDTLFLVLAVFFTLAPHAQHLPLWISGITLSLLGYRSWLTVQGRLLPPRWLLLPLALTLCAGLWLEYRTLLGRDAGVALVVILMALKLLEMHARRDVFVVLYLSFFLILTNFFYSQSILTAAFMLSALLAILLAQINLHFSHTEPSFGKKLRMASALLLQALPLMLVLFLLFPRISGPLWGLPKDAHSGKTGLSETMAPGSVASLALSGALAFRVQFDNAPPTNAALYWRGPVLDTLDEFDGRTWKALPARPTNTALRILTPAQSTPLNYTVTLEAHNKPWVFALEAPLSIPVIEQHEVQLTEHMQLLTRQPITERVRYRASSQPDFKQRIDLTAAQQEQLTDLPFGYNPRTLALAAQIRQRTIDPAQRLQQALEYFRSQPFRYTLNPPVLGRHSADEFLFDTQAGFCEHYASSFVVLLRALEIPARVVTGYQGGELNPVDGFLAVRQSDAHAWAEIWFAEQGWVRIDPTALVAPHRIERGIAPSLPDNSALPLLLRADIDWLKRLRFNWEALNNGWNQWVLSFNQERQRDLLQRLGLRNPDWQTLVLFLFGLCGITLGMTALLLWQRQRQHDPLTRLYARYCASIATHGVERLPHEGALAFADRAQRTLQPLKPEQPHLTHHVRLIQQGALLYTQLRYQALEPGTYQRKFNSLKTCINALNHC